VRRSSVELEDERGVALGDQVDRWLPHQIPQGQFMTGWIGGVEPIQKRLLRLLYDINLQNVCGLRRFFVRIRQRPRLVGLSLA
jgi:hypothetical protein